MKKSLMIRKYGAPTAAFVLMCLPVVVFAQDILNPLGQANIFTIIKSILDAAIKIAIPIAIGFIAYAGFMFVTSSGDESKLESAKKTFFWTIVGLAVLLASNILYSALQGTINKIFGLN